MTLIGISFECLHFIGTFTILSCLNVILFVFYVPLGAMYVLVLYILRSIENYFYICNKVTRA